MADQKETPKILDEIAQKTMSGPKARPQKKSAANGLTVTLLLIAPLLVAVAYLAYQQNGSAQVVTDLRTQNLNLIQDIENQRRVLDSLQSQLSAVLENPVAAPSPIDETKFTELESMVRNQAQQIEAAVNELRSTAAVSVQPPSFEWKIFEAEYLLGIANQKLQLEADIASSIALLQSADAALLASGSSRVFALRQSIANDITQLRAATPVDRQGSYFVIGSLIEEIESLDLVGSLQDGFKNRQQSGNSSSVPASSEPGVFQASLDFLSSVFVWRRWDESPSALLAPEQGQFIKQNLRLMLEQSQLALLTKDQTLYRESLRKSKDWLDRYAMVDSESGQQILRTLDELAAIAINPPLPGIDESLDMARRLSAAERQ